MIKITYKESSIECSTKEEANYVLHALNDIRKENAKTGLAVTVKVGDVRDVLQRDKIAARPSFRRGALKPN